MLTRKKGSSFVFLSKSLDGVKKFLKLAMTPRNFRRAKELVKIFGIRGFLGILKRKIIYFYNRPVSFTNQENPHPDEAVETQDLLKKLSVRPFYLDPYIKLENIAKVQSSVGIHIHLHSGDGVEYIVRYLNNIPIKYDIFVSLTNGSSQNFLKNYLQNNLENASKIKIKTVQNRGRNISHFLITFKGELSNYDILGHFHFKSSPHLNEGEVKVWMNQIFDGILGSPEKIQQVFEILNADGCLVYARTSPIWGWDESGWSDNFEVARNFLRDKELFDLNSFPEIEFPRGFMFWANSEALKPMFDLNLQFDEIPEEPLPEDGTLLHSLERLLPLLLFKEGRWIYRIESTEYSDLLFCSDYENQINYSELVKSDKPKILAYYLPQFHPIPENDIWHGVGFTEWNKVRTANPKFSGHYQQHIPHEDIGYYDLKSSSVLRQQAQMMKFAGVHGMVFYHYWFKGKMVLEDVAARLLGDETIHMPFSFCWANENWTRKWDGDDNDVLLKQEYSRSDATDFIRYLIPFFKDSRYIKVKGRPLLFVYRTIETANWGEYLEIWGEECEREGLKRPYVVATLTRGAQSASESGMDASVERVLQDWTNGQVKEQNETLSFYENFGGSVLEYSDVAAHYKTKTIPATESGGEPIFRSIVPNWDNTARYNSSAYVVHNSSPIVFQDWLSTIVADSQAINTVVDNERFIIVNAWNEWAEGAHLEPDRKHGYGYLNSIGRVLSNLSYGDIDHIELPSSITVKLTFSDLASSELKNPNYMTKRFIFALASSQIAKNGQVVIEDIEIIHAISSETGLQISTDGEFDYILHFERLLIFQPSNLDDLFKFAIRHPKFAVSGNILNEPGLIYEGNLCIPYVKRGYLQLMPKNGGREWKISPLTKFFKYGINTNDPQIKHHVNVIVRFHSKGEVSALFNCLNSLYSQSNVKVVVILCAQDLSDLQLNDINTKISNDFLNENFQVVVHQYYSTISNPDMRSLMLTEALKSLAGGYLLVLDYDDILFPHALSTLALRLEDTGKCVTFGKIYSSTLDEYGKVSARASIYNWGRTYEDFFDNNISPIHGFMINLDKMDTNRIEYHADQKYMEDYYLTLQIFNRENVDWDSLSIENYIGDYFHRISSHSPNTLAILDQEKREELLADPEYLKCQTYIDELRLRVSISNRSAE